IVYRAAWVFLYVLYLALIVIAFSAFCGVALMVIDEGGGESSRARQLVSVGQRCVMGFFYGTLGLLSAAGALKLRRCRGRINPLYPEMQIGFHLARATARERVLREHP